MKIYISGYRDHWVSPYTILEKVFFWRKIDYDEPIIVRLNKILEPFSKGFQKFLDFVHPEIRYVKIDKYDTWSMDSTLSHIILPMLKQLKATKHGAPFTDDEDVPEELRTTAAPPKEHEWDTDENHFKRWDWILDEMIYAFECTVDDSWEDKYRSGNIDWVTEPCAWDEKGKPTLYKTKDGPNHTYKCDYEGLETEHRRIKNGYRLFGKYYENLWD